MQSITLGSSVGLTAGRYWLVVVSDTTAVSLSSILSSAAGVIGAYLGGSAAGAELSGASPATGVYAAALGSLGATFTSFGTVTYNNGNPTPQLALGL